MKPGDLVRICIPPALKGRTVIGMIVGIREDNLSITGRGECYDVMTPEDGVLRMTATAFVPLDPVQDTHSEV